MKKLTIEKSFEIDSSKEVLWNLLTDLESAKQWLNEFHEGTTVDTDWNVGSKVVWKDGHGDVGASGRVAAFQENKLIVVEFPTEDNPHDDTEGSWDDYTERFELSDGNGKTVFSIKAGPIPEQHYAMHLSFREKAANKIVEMAESK